MGNVLKLSIVLFVLTLFANCNNYTNKKKSIYFLNFKDRYSIYVNKTSIQNKAIVLNDSLVLYKKSKFIYEELTPKWLFDKIKKKELLNNEYIYTPDVSDIEVSYLLIKNEKSNLFQIIKNTDTLNFDFEDFDESDRSDMQ